MYKRYANLLNSTSRIFKLELQFDTYIDIMRHDDRFNDLKNLADLLVNKLVEINRHIIYVLIYLLVKMVLLLLVAISVERVFSSMNFVKIKGRNKMNDSLLDDCLDTFIERDILENMDENDAGKTFIAIRKHIDLKNSVVKLFVI